MFDSYYRLKITGKDVKRFVKTLYKMGIYFEEIEFVSDYCYVKTDIANYKKIMTVKTSYNVQVVGLYGLKKIEAFLEIKLVSDSVIDNNVIKSLKK